MNRETMARQTVDEIRERARLRAQRVYDARGATIVPAETLAAQLHELAACWREDGEALERRKSKGWVSAKRELLALASRVAGVAEDIRALAPPTSDDTITATKMTSIITAPQELWDQAIADSADDRKVLTVDVINKIAASLPDQMTNEFSVDHTRAYLAGETDTLPPCPDCDTDTHRCKGCGTPTPHGVYACSECAILDGASPHRLSDEVKADQMTNPTVSSPFLIPSANYAPAAPAQALTFADLLRPRHRPELTQWSWSQVETSENCGVQYLARKVLDMPRIPQWSLIGGRTFHACVEAIEIMTDKDPIKDAKELWEREFNAQIAETATATTVPMEHWRASNKGLENYTWWLVNGVDMVQRYIDNRERETSRILIDHSGPFIERELRMKVNGPCGDLEFVGILDQVRQLADGSLLIVDFKSGRSSQGGDDFQLGSQAWLLAQHVHYSEPAAIKACWYDARKGTYSTAIDALSAVTWDEIVYRVHAAEGRRRAGIYSPRVSSFCGGCDVRYACPVGGR